MSLKKNLMRILLLVGMGLMIPCYLFTVGNVALSPWPLYNRNRFALVILTPVCLGILLLLGRTAKRLEKHERAMLAGFALFYFICQMLMGWTLRFTPITDLEQCWTAAQLLVDKGGFGSVERPFIYFTRYPHNLGLVYLLAGIFKFFGMLGWTDRFMQAVLICSLLFTLGLLASARLCRRLGGTQAEIRVLLFFAVCLPFLYCTTELYTDAFSLSFAPIIIWSYLKAKDSRKPVYILLFGLSAFIGAQIRFTSIIAAIACLIAGFFEKHFKLTAGLAACLVLAFCVGGAGISSANNAQLGEENIKKYTLPKLHYIAMGLPVQSDEGYGQFGYGRWLLFSTSFDTPEERDAALLQEVIDRVYYLRYPDRMLHMMSRKNLSTFGSGTFNLNEIFEADEHTPDNAVKQVLFEQGCGNRIYYHVCTAMFLAQMLLACMACVQAIRQKNTSASPLFLTLLGAFLFLCIWETRARYFFQFEMILLCACAMYRHKESSIHEQI